MERLGLGVGGGVAFCAESKVVIARETTAIRARKFAYCIRRDDMVVLLERVPGQTMRMGGIEDSITRGAWVERVRSHDERVWKIYFADVQLVGETSTLFCLFLPAGGVPLPPLYLSRKYLRHNKLRGEGVA